jgi:Leucine-rich repeat (LRR) protein
MSIDVWLAAYADPKTTAEQLDAGLRSAHAADPAAYRKAWIPRLAEVETDRTSPLRAGSHPRRSGWDGFTLDLFWVYGLERIAREIDGAPFRRQRLLIAKATKVAKALAAAPVLARLDEVDFTNSKLGDKGLIELCKSPHLGQLRALVLNSCGITDAGLNELAATHLPVLERLELSDNKLTAAGIQALVRSPLATTLRHLDIGANDIGPNGFVGANMPKLEVLNAGVCELGDAGVAKLLASKTLPALANLELGHNDLTKKTCAALASTSLPIRSLQLGGIAAGPDGAKQLAKLPKLLALDLSRAKIGDAGAAALATMKNKLVGLYLSDNAITAKGARALASLTTLRDLNLDRNAIGDAGVAALVETMRGLERLWFEKNGLTGAAVATLAKLPKLTDVELRNNKLGTAGEAAYKELQITTRARRA